MILICEGSQIFVWRNNAFIFFQKSDIFFKRRRKLCLKKIISFPTCPNEQGILKAKSNAHFVASSRCGVNGVFHLCSHWQELLWGMIDPVLFARHLFTEGPRSNVLFFISLLGPYYPLKWEGNCLELSGAGSSASNSTIRRYSGTNGRSFFVCLPHRRRFVMQSQGFCNFKAFSSQKMYRCLCANRCVKKAPCTDLRSDPTLHQNSYRTTQADAYVNHAHQTSAARVVTNLIKLKHCRVKRTVSPSTPTCWRRTPSFRSRRNTISHMQGNTDTTNKQNKTKTGSKGVPCVDLSYVKLCDTAALVH